MKITAENLDYDEIDLYDNKVAVVEKRIKKENVIIYKYGLISLTGKELLPTIYDRIKWVGTESTVTKHIEVVIMMTYCGSDRKH